MNNLILDTNYRDGTVFSAYSILLNGNSIETRINDWVVDATDSFDTMQLYALDDAKEAWSFGFDPSEGEFNAAQALLAYWQVHFQVSDQHLPLLGISPSVCASTYENIVGLRIWLKHNVGHIGWYCCLPHDERQLSFVSANIYLRTIDYWLNAIVTGGRSNPRYDNMNPVRCFRFHKRCAEHDKVDSCSSTHPGYLDFFDVYQVEVVNRDFGEYLSRMIGYFRDTLLCWMEELPVVVVRNQGTGI